jgi:23S rRNA pseudouridine2605 synthase
MSNDTAWAAAILDPANGVTKTYHVQVSPIPEATLLAAMEAGCTLADGTHLHAVHVELLRAGQRNAWLSATLDEGRNRHLRRLCEAFGLEVLRLVRVAIGPLALGELAKGAWRHLVAEEVKALRQAAGLTGS